PPQHALAATGRQCFDFKTVLPAVGLEPRGAANDFQIPQLGRTVHVIREAVHGLDQGGINGKGHALAALVLVAAPMNPANDAIVEMNDADRVARLQNRAVGVLSLRSLVDLPVDEQNIRYRLQAMYALVQIVVN